MALQRHIETLRGETETLATLDVGTMWDRLLGEFLGEWARLDRQGLEQAEMERELSSFMNGLSPKFEEDVARKTAGVAYNQGRNAELLTAADEGVAEFVVRSEILDSSTCEVCSQLDGSIFEIGKPGYLEFMPPAKCLGGDRCRGFYVAISDEVAS